MERSKVVEELIKVLKEKVPNREICRIADTKQLDRIFLEIDYEPLASFLSDKNLELKIEEFPNDLWFEMVLILIMDARNYEGVGYFNSEIFSDDCSDKINDILDIITDNECHNISFIPLDKLLEYAKSNKSEI